MNANPLVSIIIPTLNNVGFVGETLRSVKMQTYPHFEAIIMDGGSVDGTVAVAQWFAASDPRFKVLRLSDRISCERPVSAARNEAVAASTGELVAFLDADDVWFGNKLGRQVELFHQHPEVSFSFTNFYFWDGENDMDTRYKTRNFPPDKPRVKLIYSCLYGLSSVMVRRELFNRVNGFDETIPAAEDWDLWLRMAEAGMVSRGVREPMLRYRQHLDNVSKNIVYVDQYALRLLEKNRDRTRFPTDLPHYRRSLQRTRSHLELARARQLLETDPDKVAPVLYRAWRARPLQVKWFWRWVCAAWPHVLGGDYTSAHVQRMLRAKF